MHEVSPTTLKRVLSFVRAELAKNLINLKVCTALSNFVSHTNRKSSLLIKIHHFRPPAITNLVVLVIAKTPNKTSKSPINPV